MSTSGVRRPRGGALALAMALVVGASGCGIPTDSEPRAISSDAVPPPLQPTTSVEPPTAEEATGVDRDLFLVVTDDEGDRRLVVIPVVFEQEPDEEDMLRRLVARDGLSNDPDVSNAIPPDLEVLRFHIDDDGVGVITLNGPLGAEGETLRLATAQLVFTATELGNVDKVQFRDEDTDLRVPVADREAEQRRIVSRSDYEDFRPRVNEPVVITTGPSR
jgi:hypothetical protein